MARTGVAHSSSTSSISAALRLRRVNRLEAGLRVRRFRYVSPVVSLTAQYAPISAGSTPSWLRLMKTMSPGSNLGSIESPCTSSPTSCPDVSGGRAIRSSEPTSSYEIEPPAPIRPTIATSSSSRSVGWQSSASLILVSQRSCSGRSPRSSLTIVDFPVPTRSASCCCVNSARSRSFLMLLAMFGLLGNAWERSITRVG